MRKVNLLHQGNSYNHATRLCSHAEHRERSNSATSGNLSCILMFLLLLLFCFVCLLLFFCRSSQHGLWHDKQRQQSLFFSFNSTGLTVVVVVFMWCVLGYVAWRSPSLCMPDHSRCPPSARSGGSWLWNLQWCPSGQPDYRIGLSVHQRTPLADWA